MRRKPGGNSKMSHNNQNQSSNVNELHLVQPAARTNSIQLYITSESSYNRCNVCKMDMTSVPEQEQEEHMESVCIS